MCRNIDFFQMTNGYHKRWIQCRALNHTIRKVPGIFLRCRLRESRARRGSSRSKHLLHSLLSLPSWVLHYWKMVWRLVQFVFFSGHKRTSSCKSDSAFLILKVRIKNSRNYSSKKSVTRWSKYFFAFNR